MNDTIDNKMNQFIDSLRNKKIHVKVFNVPRRVFIQINTLDGSHADVIYMTSNNKVMAGENCLKFGNDYRPGSYISDIDKLTKDIIKYFHPGLNDDVEDSLMSIPALNWLHSVDYYKRTHEERITLISAAKILYP